MSRARTCFILTLTAAIWMMLPGAAPRAETCPGRCWRNECWYRVYFRECADGCWNCYGTYNDCGKAQDVVNYLLFEGVEAYYKGI